jgi:hypothetical protein
MRKIPSLGVTHQGVDLSDLDKLPINVIFDDIVQHILDW